MTPIILPPPTHPSWERAIRIVAALRAKNKSNPFIVAAIVNAYAESAWQAVIVGDNDKSFGPWQMNWKYYGEPILEKLKIDIRTEPTFEKHVEAVLWALGKIEKELDATTDSSEATRIWVAEFERASAQGAVERRVALAPQIENWLKSLT